MSLRSRLLLLTALAWLASAPTVHARRDLTVGALQTGIGPAKGFGNGLLLCDREAA